VLSPDCRNAAEAGMLMEKYCEVGEIFNKYHNATALITRFGLSGAIMTGTVAAQGNSVALLETGKLKGFRL
jgi:hypothetical protein